jgi:4-hydroxy-tetrahydrodipicolinate reductase
MKIALIGYGKMGRTIEALGLQQGHSFPVRVDVDNREDLNEAAAREIDVAIEFSTPGAAPGNILNCLELGIPVVSGTTGWNERLGEVTEACRQKGGAFFYASNFSIGVNILFAMNRKLAEIMNSFPEYTVSVEEVHHVHKLDAPSGTAISLASQIIGNMERVKGWSLEKEEGTGKMHISAIREGEVKGRHTITYDSALDSISLAHDARSRDAFASGALMAAVFLKDRKGIFGMNDLLKF